MLSNSTPAAMSNIGDNERIASGLGGALLLGLGLARPSLFNTLLAVGGAFLLERGLTGSCSIYRAFGVSTRKERPRYGKRGARSIVDEIEQAAEDSFPASDPPSWTPHRAGHPAGVG